MSDGPALENIHIRFLAGRLNAGGALDEIVAVLHSTTDPDPELILDVGCGVLESLLFEHEEELWPTIERLAREDVRFRRALTAVWAYDSPAFERREALLAELGESRTVTVSFVIQAEDFGELPLVSHRAVDINGEVPGGQLPRILRDIADRYEHTHHDELPEVMRDRRLREAFLPWSEARSALKIAWHELDVSPNLGSRTKLVHKIERLTAAEAQAWDALREVLLAKTDPT